MSVPRMAFFPIAALVIVAIAFGACGARTPASGSSAPSFTVVAPLVSADSTVPSDAKSPAAPPSPAPLPALFEQGKSASPVHYRFAVEKGARFVPTSDGRAFVLIWMPPGSDPATTPILATLHGHDAWAFDEFSVWYNVASARGVGIVALQWWFGSGDGLGDYYAPNELNREFTRALQALGTAPGMAVLQGFSRGAANIYGVTAYDRNGGSRYFALTVAVAGKASPDFPVNRDLVAGRFGSAPFAGSHWGMYCGEKDPTPDRDGCPGMREAERFVTGLGGSVDLFIDDPLGDHGGFSKTTSNQTRVLDLFAQLLAQKAQ